MYKKYFKRVFDIIFSIIGIILTLPVMLIISILIFLDSGCPIIFKQVRITKNKKEFFIYKFRTMIIGAEKEGVLTIGNDPRVTRIGRFLRKSKLDELPQFFNIIKGEMSFVGPRPDAREELKNFKEEWDDVFSIKSGITDYSSIKFSDLENQLDITNPYEDYVFRILPKKIELRREYIKNITFCGDIRIIFLTLKKIFKN